MRLAIATRSEAQHDARTTTPKRSSCVIFPCASLSTCTNLCEYDPTGMIMRPGLASCSKSAGGIVRAAAPT